MMDILELESELRKAIEATAYLDVGWEALKKFSDSGGSKVDARSLLERLHGEAPNELQEDRIVELLDYVEGWCQRAHRIWDDD
jgi:hypothetical protein